jgi:hypothetical protein
MFAFGSWTGGPEGSSTIKSQRARSLGYLKIFNPELCALYSLVVSPSLCALFPRLCSLAFSDVDDSPDPWTFRSRRYRSRRRAGRLPRARPLLARRLSTYDFPFDPGLRRSSILPNAPLPLREIIDSERHSPLFATSRENVNDTSDQKPGVQPMSFQPGVNFRQA